MPLQSPFCWALLSIAFSALTAHSQPVLIRDINPGAAGSIPFSNFTPHVLGNQLVFVADDGVHGEELWRSDGREAGTFQISGSSVVVFELLDTLNNNLLFLGSDFTNGTELWITDGSVAGTKLLKDIYPGFLGSNMTTSMARYKQMLVFGARDNVHGDELWSTDGTSAGTQLFYDLNSGASGSQPNDFQMIGDTLYVTADMPGYGREWWRYDLVPPVAEIAANADTACAGNSILFSTRAGHRELPG